MIELDVYKTKMNNAMDHLADELSQIRTGAANANMLDRVEVDYYGSPTPVKQIASISIQEGRIIVIKPYDRQSLKDIEKAINVADLGIAPQNDGTVIRLTVPQLTEQTRKEMCKKVSKIGETVKVQIRNIRRDANDAIKKDKEIPEDTAKDLQNKIQKLTDEFVKKIDTAVSAKEKEVMKV